ncbi:NAD(P)-binding protein [Aspergillus insuetus]
MSETILVTGASGFLASHIILRFLEAGYNVRGTVRSTSTAERVKARYPRFSDQLSFAIVSDIAVPGAFNDAVKGVTGVIHTASPFALEVADNEKDLLQPAIQGTLNIVEAVAEYGSGVRRVIVTASFASMLDLDQAFRPGYRYTEADWNPCSYETARTTSSATMAYCASKALAEKALWDWVAEKKPAFGVTTICPPWIFGPTIDEGWSKLNESTETIWNLINGSLSEVPDNDFAAFVNIHDAAQAHLRAYESEKAAGDRFIVAGGRFVKQEACDIIRRRFPELQDKVPKGIPGDYIETYIADGSKARDVLGLEYRDLETTMVEAVEDLLKKHSA